MDFIVKLLFLGGKYISQAAGRTILEIYHRSRELGRQMSVQYEKASEIIKPYDNMLELLHERAKETSEDDIHFANMNDTLKKQLEEHLKQMPKIKWEQINELIKDDLLSTEMKKEWKNNESKSTLDGDERNDSFTSAEDNYARIENSFLTKDLEYDNMYTDLCKDLSSCMAVKPLQVGNNIGQMEMFSPIKNIAFTTNESLKNVDVTPHGMDNSSNFNKEYTPIVLDDLEKKINDVKREMFGINVDTNKELEEGFNLEYLKKIQKTDGTTPLSSLYGKDASYMKYLVDQSPSNSYFNVNAISEQTVQVSSTTSPGSKEQSRCSDVPQTQMSKSKLLNTDEIMRINSKCIIRGLRQEIENRMVLLNKNKQHFKRFEKKLHDSIMKSKVAQVASDVEARSSVLAENASHYNKFESNLEKKLKRKIDKMVIKRTLSVGKMANSRNDLIDDIKHFIDLLKVNEREFQKLERRVTQRLLRHTLDNVNCMKINYKEINKPACKSCLMNTDKEDMEERQKIIEINRKVFEKFEKDMRNIVILKKHLHTDKEDKLIDEGLSKCHVNTHYSRNDKLNFIKMERLQAKDESKSEPESVHKKQVDSHVLKCGLSSTDSEDIRQRTEILKANAKAFEVFERNVKKFISSEINLPISRPLASTNDRNFRKNTDTYFKNCNNTNNDEFDTTKVMQTLKEVLEKSAIFKPRNSITNTKHLKVPSKIDISATDFVKIKKTTVKKQNMKSIPRYVSPVKKEKHEGRKCSGISLMNEKSKDLRKQQQKNKSVICNITSQRGNNNSATMKSKICTNSSEKFQPKNEHEQSPKQNDNSRIKSESGKKLSGKNREKKSMCLTNSRQPDKAITEYKGNSIKNSIVSADNESFNCRKNKEIIKFHSEKKNVLVVQQSNKIDDESNTTTSKISADVDANSSSQFRHGNTGINKIRNSGITEKSDSLLPATEVAQDTNANRNGGDSSVNENLEKIAPGDEQISLDSGLGNKITKIRSSTSKIAPGKNDGSLPQGGGIAFKSATKKVKSKGKFSKDTRSEHSQMSNNDTDGFDFNKKHLLSDKMNQPQSLKKDCSHNGQLKSQSTGCLDNLKANLDGEVRVSSKRACKRKTYPKLSSLSQDNSVKSVTSKHSKIPNFVANRNVKIEKEKINKPDYDGNDGIAIRSNAKPGVIGDITKLAQSKKLDDESSEYHAKIVNVSRHILRALEIIEKEINLANKEGTLDAVKKDTGMTISTPTKQNKDAVKNASHETISKNNGDSYNEEMKTRSNRGNKRKSNFGSEAVSSDLHADICATIDNYDILANMPKRRSVSVQSVSKLNLSDRPNTLELGKPSSDTTIPKTAKINDDLKVVVANIPLRSSCNPNSKRCKVDSLIKSLPKKEIYSEYRKHKSRINTLGTSQKFREQTISQTIESSRILKRSNSAHESNKTVKNVEMREKKSIELLNKLLRKGRGVEEKQNAEFGCHNKLDSNLKATSENVIMKHNTSTETVNKPIEKSKNVEYTEEKRNIRFETLHHSVGGSRQTLKNTERRSKTIQSFNKIDIPSVNTETNNRRSLDSFNKSTRDGKAVIDKVEVQRAKSDDSLNKLVRQTIDNLEYLDIKSKKCLQFFNKTSQNKSPDDIQDKSNRKILRYLYGQKFSNNTTSQSALRISNENNDELDQKQTVRSHAVYDTNNNKRLVKDQSKIVQIDAVSRDTVVKCVPSKGKESRGETVKKVESNDRSNDSCSIGRFRLRKIIAFVPADVQTFDALQSVYEKNQNDKDVPDNHCRCKPLQNISAGTNLKEAEKISGIKNVKFIRNNANNIAKPETTQKLDVAETNKIKTKQKFSFIPLRQFSLDEIKKYRNLVPATDNVKRQDNVKSNSLISSKSDQHKMEINKDANKNDRKTIIGTIKDSKPPINTIQEENVNSNYKDPKNLPQETINSEGIKKFVTQENRTKKQNMLTCANKIEHETTPQAQEDNHPTVVVSKLVQGNIDLIKSHMISKQNRITKNQKEPKMRKHLISEPFQSGRSTSLEENTSSSKESSKLLVKTEKSRNELKVREPTLERNQLTTEKTTRTDKCDNVKNQLETTKKILEENRVRENIQTPMVTLPFKRAKFSFIPLKKIKFTDLEEVNLLKADGKEKLAETGQLIDKNEKVKSKIPQENPTNDEVNQNKIFSLPQSNNTPSKEKFQVHADKEKTIRFEEEKKYQGLLNIPDAFTNKNVIGQKVDANRQDKTEDDRLKAQMLLEELRKEISKHEKLYSSKGKVLRKDRSQTEAKTNAQPLKTQKKQPIVDNKINEIDESQPLVKEGKIPQRLFPKRDKVSFREAKFSFIPLKTVENYTDPDNTSKKVGGVTKVKPEEKYKEIEREYYSFPDGMSPLLRYFMSKRICKGIPKGAKTNSYPDDHHLNENNLSKSRGTRASKNVVNIKKTQKAVDISQRKTEQSIYTRYPFLLKYKTNRKYKNKTPSDAFEWKMRFIQQTQIKRSTKDEHYNGQPDTLRKDPQSLLKLPAVSNTRTGKRNYNNDAYFSNKKNSSIPVRKRSQFRKNLLFEDEIQLYSNQSLQSVFVKGSPTNQPFTIKETSNSVNNSVRVTFLDE